MNKSTLSTSAAVNNFATIIKIIAGNLKMFTQLITFFLVAVGIVSIHSLPMNNKARRALSTTDPSSAITISPAITISQSVLDVLTDVTKGTSKGFFPLQMNAKSLSNDELFNSEVV